MENKSSFVEVIAYLKLSSKSMLMHNGFEFVFKVIWYGAVMPSLLVTSASLAIGALVNAFVGSTLDELGGALVTLSFFLALLFIIYIKVETLKEAASNYFKYK